MSETKAEIVIEKEIIRGVYSFPELMYRNKNRFEMILSQPDDRTHFEKVKAVFKGRYICKNDSCLQDKRESEHRNKNDDSDNENDDDIHKGWMAWWEKQDKVIKPEVKVLEETDNEISNVVEAKEEFETKLVEKNLAKKKKYIPKVKEQEEKSKEKENTRWSSSLTYVIMYYRSYPESLENLKKVYNRKSNNKCEIYFYVELMGQKCRTCKSDEFCYPFFGKTELKRMRKNFSSYIFNKIEGKPILRYKPCPLKRLKGHVKELCQACELGECGIKCLPCI